MACLRLEPVDAAVKTAEGEAGRDLRHDIQKRRVVEHQLTCGGRRAGLETQLLANARMCAMGEIARVHRPLDDREEHRRNESGKLHVRLLGKLSAEPLQVARDPKSGSVDGQRSDVASRLRIV